MLAIVISDYGLISSYIRNSLKVFKNIQSVINFNSSLEQHWFKYAKQIDDHNGAVVLVDLDEKLNLRKQAESKMAATLHSVSAIRDRVDVNLLFVGSQETISDWELFLVNENIGHHQVLTKPFNRVQLDNFLKHNMSGACSLPPAPKQRTNCSLALT